MESVFHFQKPENGYISHANYSARGVLTLQKCGCASLLHPKKHGSPQSVTSARKRGQGIFDGSPPKGAPAARIARRGPQRRRSIQLYQVPEDRQTRRRDVLVLKFEPVSQRAGRDCVHFECAPWFRRPASTRPWSDRLPPQRRMPP